MYLRVRCADLMCRKAVLLVCCVLCMCGTGNALFRPKSDWYHNNHEPVQHEASDEVGALGLMEQAVQNLFSSLLSSTLSVYFKECAHINSRILFFIIR